MSERHSRGSDTMRSDKGELRAASAPVACFPLAFHGWDSADEDTEGSPSLTKCCPEVCWDRPLKSPGIHRTGRGLLVPCPALLILERGRRSLPSAPHTCPLSQLPRVWRGCPASFGLEQTDIWESLIKFDFWPSSIISIDNQATPHIHLHTRRWRHALSPSRLPFLGSSCWSSGCGQQTGTSFSYYDQSDSWNKLFSPLFYYPDWHINPDEYIYFKWCDLKVKCIL